MNARKKSAIQILFTDLMILAPLNGPQIQICGFTDIGVGIGPIRTST